MPNPFALPEGMALFTFHGRVVRGKRLGSRLGFPTANIAYDPRSRTWPREGVYVGVAQLDGESRGYVSTRAGIPPFPKESQRWKPICWVTRTATSTVWS